MRTVSDAIKSAIETPSAYSMKAKLILQKNRVFFSSIDSNYPPSFADDLGWMNDDLQCDTVYPTSGSGLVTFYNVDEQLKYTTQGDSSAVTVTSGELIGKPGTSGSSLFKINSDGKLYRYTINYAIVQSHGSTILGDEELVGSPTSGSGAVHAISDTEVVYVMPADGGIKPIVYTYSGSVWHEFVFPCRFMFPVKVESTNTTGIPTERMTNYSGAAKLGNKIFIYQSNLLAGTVEGVYYDTVYSDWSDVFTAVPTDLSVSLCEFRVSNCYSVDNTVYMSGLFRRSEEKEATEPYTLILSSTDGKTFSISRISLVSALGYRFKSLVNDGVVYINHCNRISSAPVTHYLSPTSGSSGYTLEVYVSPDIVSISDTNGETATIKFAAGDNYILDSGYLEVGNRIILQLGYLTSGSAPEFVDYSIYNIDTIDFDFENGLQAVTAGCVNESTWQLVGLVSPFYTEIISKSSEHMICSTMDDDEAKGYWAEATGGGLSEDVFSVDFWHGTGYSSGSVQALDFSTKNGLDDFYSSGSHCVGMQTDLLTDELGCSGFPTCTSGTVHAKIYGWSFNDAAPQYQGGDPGSENDVVSCRLIMIDPDDTTETEYYVEATGQKFPNTYPVGYETSGSYPIEYDFSVTVGHQIKRIVLVFAASVSTSFYPHRVDITSGINLFYPYKTGTLWDFSSGSYAEVPGKLRPYVMSAIKPFNAWNFQIAASFSNSVVGSLPGNQASAGLAGLINDGGNYVVARYNKTTENVELAKIREHEETLLTSGSTTFEVGDDFDMMFLHKDGEFYIYLKEGTDWILQLEYSWKESDGYMLNDVIASIYVGIYGYIGSPYFRTVGFKINEDDYGVSESVGIPVLPGFSQLSSFPASGQVDVDDITYNYSSIVMCDAIRGPSQYRNTTRWAPEFGNGPAVEITDHDWSQAAGYLTGYWTALDDGYSYEITDSLWRPWITTNGAHIDLPGRSRFYSGDEIMQTTHGLYNKTYITGGLSDVSVSSGDVTPHPWGSEVYYHVGGAIRCNWFYGSSGDYDATVRDLIDKISRISGAKATFSGDHEITSQTVHGIYTAGSLSFVEGFDIYFDTDLYPGDWFKIKSDTSVVTTSGSDTHSSIKISCTSGSSYKAEFLLDSTATVVDMFPFQLNGAGRFRVLYHDDFATVYVNDHWICTFCPESIAYANNMDVVIATGQSTVFTNICLTELCDWREAVYIDFETDSKSAIGSVIQERPVEVYPQPDGSLSYWYEPDRETITQVEGHIRRHNVSRGIPRSSSSDGIVYYSEVGTIRNENYAAEYGFSTRVYRMPNLTMGAIKAARISQQREYENGYMHNLSVRADVRLQPGDILDVSYTAIGSGRSYNFAIVLTEVSLSMSGDRADATMQLRGRSI